MAKRSITINAKTSAREVVDMIDPRGWGGIKWRLERIEEVLEGMSRRSRLILLNALLRGELDAARAKPERESE